MFRKFFSALTMLTANTEAFAQSIAQANERFRSSLTLDHIEEVPALEHEPEPAVNGTGKRRKAAV